MCNKSKATWLPPIDVFLWQILVSIKSYLTLLFFSPKKDGVKRFFISNYHVKKDELIFDGSSNGYFGQIEKVLNLSLLEGGKIVDLGCGTGALYGWLQSKNINVQMYIGVDFAYVAKTDGSVKICHEDNVSWVQDPSNYGYIFNANIIMSNSLCYTNDPDLLNIFSQCKNAKRIIIIEPYPNLFWDAHFDGVRPIYRKHPVVSKALRENGFSIKAISIDHIFSIRHRYIGPISYCIFAEHCH